MFITPAYAQDAAGGAAGFLSALQAQLPQLLLIFAVFYFVLIRPQQKRAKQQRETLGAMKRGDRVITAGGIIGTVARVKDGADEIEVDIAQGVRVTVLRSTISDVLKPVAANDTVAAKT